MCRIYEEFDEAVDNHRWDVAVSILTGVSEVAEDILNCGDDSAGELGAIVDECFEKWMDLIKMELPEDVENHIFNLALGKFKEKDLKGWDWWWSWIEIAIELANTSTRQNFVLSALDEIKKPTNDDWSGNYAYNQARSCRRPSNVNLRMTTLTTRNSEENSSRRHGTKVILMKFSAWLKKELIMIRSTPVWYPSGKNGR